MRNIIAITMAIVGIAAFAYAGGQSENSASTGEVSEQVSITVFTEWVGAHPFAEYWSQRLEAFRQEHPNIEVEVEEVPGSNEASMDGKLKVLISAGELPDVFYTNDRSLVELARRANLLSDLSAFLEEDESFREHLDSADLRSWNGSLEEIYGITSHKDFFGYFYNKEMFEEAGIEPAKTWDEFFDNMERLKSIGVAPITLETRTAWVPSLVLLAMLGTTEAGNELALTPSPESYETPEFVDAADKLQQMFMQYTTPDAIGGDYAIALNNFMNEQAAIHPNGTWEIGNIRDNAPDGFYEKVGVALYPGNGVFSFPAYAWFSGSENEEEARAAYEFIRHFNGAEDQLVRLDQLSFMPSSEKVDISNVDIDPLMREYIDMRSEVEYQLMSPWRVYQASVTAIISQELGSLATGTTTPEEFAENLTEAANQ